jgi:hypothetical protein
MGLASLDRAKARNASIEYVNQATVNRRLRPHLNLALSRRWSKAVATL